MNKAQEFCLAVIKLAERYELPVFVVTNGASATRNDNCEAVANARQSHIKWELKNKINPNNDWLKKGVD